MCIIRCIMRVRPQVLMCCIGPQCGSPTMVFMLMAVCECATTGNRMRCPAALLVCDPASPPQGCDHVLMATGRKPNTEDLGLEQVRAGLSPTHSKQARACTAGGTRHCYLRRCTGQAAVPVSQRASVQTRLQGARIDGRCAQTCRRVAVGCIHTDAGSLKALT